jgi:hypothetical protein
VLSLHHINPLQASCAHLGELLRPGAPLVIDEFDVERFDERAAAWWLEQRRALGFTEPSAPTELVAELRRQLHPFAAIVAALGSRFELLLPQRGSYLYR